MQFSSVSCHFLALSPKCVSQYAVILHSFFSVKNKISQPHKTTSKLHFCDVQYLCFTALYQELGYPLTLPQHERWWHWLDAAGSGCETRHVAVTVDSLTVTLNTKNYEHQRSLVQAEVRIVHLCSRNQKPHHFCRASLWRENEWCGVYRFRYLNTQVASSMLQLWEGVGDRLWRHPVYL